jgi:Lysylphosphatidylglycerol synthase TM region
MLRAFFLIVGLSVSVYLVLALGPRDILALLSRIGWGFVPIAGLYAGYQAARAWALRLSAARPGAIAYADAIAVRFSGEAIQFLTSTGPFLAEPSRALLLGRRGLTKPEGFAAAIGEYLAYTFVSAVLLAIAMGYFVARVDLSSALRNTAVALLAVSVVFLAVSAVAIANRIYLIGGVIKRLGRLPIIGRRVQLDAEAVRRTEDLLLGVLRERPGRFTQILLLETLAHAILVVELWWILRMSELASGFDLAFLLESATKFTGLAFFFIPGQIGASEGVNIVLFHALGFSGAAGVGVALARRVRSALAAAAGLLALALIMRRARAPSSHPPGT